MTYSSKIMILMMGLSKNLKSHTCISTKYNMGNAYLTHLPHLSIVTMELRGCGGTPGDEFWTVVPFSSKLTGRGYCP